LQPDGIGNYYSNEDLLEDDRLQLTWGEAVDEPKISKLISLAGYSSPPARWGLLDFIRVVLLLLLG
jgi:hypothetical protein